MTPRDAFQREPSTTQSAMLLQRFDGIVGTGWIIATRRRQKWRQRHLISPNEQHEHEFHPAVTASLCLTLSHSVSFSRWPVASPPATSHSRRRTHSALREQPCRARPSMPSKATAPCESVRAGDASRGSAPQRNDCTAARSLPHEGDAEGKRCIAPRAARCEFASPEHGRPRDLLRASVATHERGADD